MQLVVSLMHRVPCKQTTNSFRQLSYIYAAREHVGVTAKRRESRLTTTLRVGSATSAMPSPFGHSAQGGAFRECTKQFLTLSFRASF